MYCPHLLLLDELVWATWALCYFAALLTEWGLLFNIFCVLKHFYLNAHSTSPTSLILMWQVVYLYLTCLLIAQIIIFFLLCRIIVWCICKALVSKNIMLFFHNLYSCDWPVDQSKKKGVSTLNLLVQTSVNCS